ASHAVGDDEQGLVVRDGEGVVVGLAPPAHVGQTGAFGRQACGALAAGGLTPGHASSLSPSWATAARSAWRSPARCSARAPECPAAPRSPPSRARPPTGRRPG